MQAVHRRTKEARDPLPTTPLKLRGAVLVADQVLPSYVVPVAAAWVVLEPVLESSDQFVVGSRCFVDYSMPQDRWRDRIERSLGVIYMVSSDELLAFPAGLDPDDVAKGVKLNVRSYILTPCLKMTSALTVAE